MSRMTLQAAVAMGQLQQQLDNISNNIANSNTTGYKQRNANFSSLLAQQFNTEPDPLNQAGRQTPEGFRLGAGSRLGHTNFQFSPGSLQTTDRNLDVALQEDHQFFQVRAVENGQEEVQYTRAGNFYLSPVADEQLMLVTAEGQPVLGANQEPIVLANDMDDLKIEANGEINVTRNSVQNVEGQLGVIAVDRPKLLEASGSNQFRLSEDTLENYPIDEVINEVAANQMNLQNGALESSNVDIAKQTTDMLESQRAYQFNARTISMHDQMNGLINQLR
ncbi:flagellar hook-basal body protein [Gracilibacillus phocaeensis]|uniref:flagellar hook-basal body protein n=1 Tax=Gracilibacillus phocaeensis TaxID=2042304 RepID=UPI00103099D8|nr:flagellar hook-basal body protein [Gracilibacillus phocaeensis]